MTHVGIAWQVKSKENGSWGPPIQKRKIAKQLEREDFEVRELIVKPVFDEVAERLKFENFLTQSMLYIPSELEFCEGRNCYVAYRIHLAWQCWRKALE